MTRSCASCRHSVLRTWNYGSDETPDDRTWLECTRYPPQVYVQRGVMRQTFPTAVLPCGEWSPSVEDLRAEVDEGMAVARPNPTRIIHEAATPIRERISEWWASRR